MREPRGFMAFSKEVKKPQISTLVSLQSKARNDLIMKFTLEFTIFIQNDLSGTKVGFGH